MYRASDEVDNEEWLAELESAADRLGLGTDAGSRAADLVLSANPESDRAKRGVLGAAG